MGSDERSPSGNRRCLSGGKVDVVVGERVSAEVGMYWGGGGEGVDWRLL